MWILLNPKVKIKAYTEPFRCEVVRVIDGVCKVARVETRQWLVNQGYEDITEKVKALGLESASGAEIARAIRDGVKPKPEPEPEALKFESPAKNSGRRARGKLRKSKRGKRVS